MSSLNFPLIQNTRLPDPFSSEIEEVDVTLASLERSILRNSPLRNAVCAFLTVLQRTYVEPTLPNFVQLTDIFSSIESYGDKFQLQEILEAASGMVSVYGQYHEMELTSFLSEIKKRVSILDKPIEWLPARSERVLKKWLVNEREVSLFATNTDLRYKIINKERMGFSFVEKEEEVLLWDDPDLNKRPLAERIDAVATIIARKRYPRIRKPEESVKADFLSVCYSWSLEHTWYRNQEVLFLWGDGKPSIWMWYSKDINENQGQSKRPLQFYQTPLTATHPNNSCSRETVDAIQEFVSHHIALTREEQRSFLENFWITEANDFLLRIELQPKAFHSRLDETMAISYYQWAVTAIAYKGPLGKLANLHAQLVIEGVKGGRYFAHSYGFDGECYGKRSGVQFIDKTNNPFRGSRSDVWKCSRKDVEEKLLPPIHAEIADPNLLPKLNILGNSSIFTGKDKENCFDWVEGKLKLVDVHFRFGPIKQMVAFIAKPTSIYLSSGQSEKEEECPHHFSRPFNELV